MLLYVPLLILVMEIKAKKLTYTLEVIAAMYICVPNIINKQNLAVLSIYCFSK